MTFKKNDLVAVVKCPCMNCSGESDSTNCVREAIGKAHIVRKIKRNGRLSTACGLTSDANDVVARKKSVKNVCADCSNGNVIWHQPSPYNGRHEEILDGIESLHHLVGGLISFVTAHAHPNAEDGCKVCADMKKQFDEHRKSCPDCHE